MRSLRETGSVVRALAWRADGQAVAAAIEDGSLWEWPREGSAAPRLLSGRQSRFAVGYLGQAGRLVSGGKDRRLWVWGTSPKASGGVFRMVCVSGAMRVRFGHHAPWLVASGPNGELWRFEAGSGVTNWTVQGTHGRMGGLAITPDDAWVLSGGASGRIEVRSSTNGALGKELTAGTWMIRALAIHPDGGLVAAGGDDGVLRLLDLASGRVQRAYPAQNVRIGRIGFSAEGQYVWCGGPDHRLVAWPVRGTNQVAALPLPGTVDDFDVGGDGTLVTIARQGGGQVWQFPELRLIAKTEFIPAGLRAVACTPQGQRMLTADDAGAWRCWDARTGIQLLHLPLPGVRVREMRLSADGDHLALVGMNGELYLSP